MQGENTSALNLFAAAIVANPHNPDIAAEAAQWLEANNDPHVQAFRLFAAMRQRPHSTTTEIIEETMGFLPGTLALARDAGNLNGAMPVKSSCSPEGEIQQCISLVKWLNQKPIHWAATRMRLLSDWEKAMRHGDVQAILAHPDSRRCLERCAFGKRFIGMKRFTGNRKAFAQAVKIFEARLTRRAARRASQQASHRPISSMQDYQRHLIQERKSIALEIAQKYHNETEQLYTSQRGRILYGPGGKEEKEWCYRGSYKTWPARWRNAGARLDSVEKPTCVILENYLGKVVAKIPFPRQTDQKELAVKAKNWLEARRSKDA